MTIKEIAALAGTSRGTVDRVLNGRGNVKPELAEKILRIARANNYQPNQLAQALINSRRHMTIGVVINSLGNAFFDEVLRGIRNRAQKYASYGLQVLIKEIKGYSGSEQLRAIDEVLQAGIDALAIMPIDLPEVQAKLESLNIPIVMFNTDIRDMDKLAFVGCDYYNSGGLSGDITKLILGRKGGSVGLVIGSFMLHGHKLRVEGFSDSIAEYPGIRLVSCVENADDDKQSYAVTQALIAEHKPDLIYFAAAGIEGGLQAVLDSGRDIRVITVDETQITKEHLKSGLISATVTQQPYEQGILPIKILFQHLFHGKTPRTQYIYTENQVKLKSAYD